MFKCKFKLKLNVIFFLTANNYLARGHLSPDADFIYGEMQDATYYYFNVAPQWQNFNNGNWKFVEIAVRNLAKLQKKTLRVQTGTFQTLRLSDSKITLGKNSVLPVPLYFWKLVYDKQLKQATVFVVINHPLLKENDIPIIYDLCSSESETLCEDLSWNFRTRKKAKKGLLYCCSYQSLKKKIPWLENLTTNDAANSNIGLLKNAVSK